MQRNAHEEKILLRLPAYRIMEYCFEKAHHWLQYLSYHNPPLKSIHKKQQIFFYNSTSITELSAPVDHGFHRVSFNLIGIRTIGFSLDVPSTGHNSCKMFESSLVVSRAWTMISFWAETPFWTSSLHAQPVLPVLTRIPPERKGDPSRVPLLHGGIYFICEWPATRGLGAICSAYPWLSIHAALVSFKKTWPTEHTEYTENTEKPAHELHEFPRTEKNIRPQITRINTDYKQKADFRRGEPPCSPIYYSSITLRFHDKLAQAQSIRPNKVIPKDKSPEPAQGMNHTLSLAPQGVLGCFGTGDIFYRIPPVPQRPYLLFTGAPLSVTFYHLNGFIWEPPLIAPTGGAFWVMSQANFEDFGRQDHHPLRPPAVFSYLIAYKIIQGET
jgi:hypothetical protein